MMKRTLVFLVLTISGLAAACDGEGVSEPLLTRLELMPTEAALFAGPPRNTVQLTIQAYDQRGRPIPDPGVATYSSSDPTIAEVGGSGLVTGVAPGTAEISVTVTRAGVTQSVSTTVTIWLHAADPVYDLTATITDFDPAWGDLSGYRYTATVSFDRDYRYAPGIGGSYWNLRLTGPDGDPAGYEGWVGNGAITSHFDWSRRVVVELGTNFTLLPAGDLVAPVIEGRFEVGGHIGGPFTLRLREGEDPG